MLLYTNDLGNPAPITYPYGAAAAAILGYDTADLLHDDWMRSWYPRTRIPKDALFAPTVIAQSVSLSIATLHSRLSLYLMDDDQMSALVRGYPFPEDTLQEIFAAWAPLPYSALAVKTLRDRIDWMEANPGYRGIPVKENAKERRTMGARDA